MWNNYWWKLRYVVVIICTQIILMLTLIIEMKLIIHIDIGSFKMWVVKVDVSVTLDLTCVAFVIV